MVEKGLVLSILPWKYTWKEPSMVFKGAGTVGGMSLHIKIIGDMMTIFIQLASISFRRTSQKKLTINQILKKNNLNSCPKRTILFK